MRNTECISPHQVYGVYILEADKSQGWGFLAFCASSSSKFWGIACPIQSQVSKFPIRLSKDQISMTIDDDPIIHFVCTTYHITSVCVQVLAVNVELIDYAHTMGRPRLHVPGLKIIKGEQRGLSLSPERSNVVVIVAPSSRASSWGVPTRWGDQGFMFQI